jgi:hypothetical protein
MSAAPQGDARVDNWILEILLAAVVIGLLGYLAYSALFANSAGTKAGDNAHRGFERRAPEQTDRRKAKLGPPAAGERRQQTRRADERVQ